MSALMLAAPASVGCARLQHRVNADATTEEPPALLSRLEMRDKRSEAQILYGLHGLEQGAWRWSMRKFAVKLHPPRGATLQGARLEMSFSFPPSLAELLKKLVVTASIQGRRLTPFVTPGPGEHVFSAAVPKELLQDQVVTVEFSLSDAVPAGKMDTRELGIVVGAIWFAEP